MNISNKHIINIYIYINCMQHTYTTPCPIWTNFLSVWKKIIAPPSIRFCLLPTRNLSHHCRVRWRWKVLYQNMVMMFKKGDWKFIVMWYLLFQNGWLDFHQPVFYWISCLVSYWCRNFKFYSSYNTLRSADWHRCNKDPGLLEFRQQSLAGWLHL